MENLFTSRVGEPRKYSSPITRPLLLLSMLLVSILVFPGSMQAQTLPPLGTAVNFGLLGASTVTNTGASIVQGDVGVWPGTSIIGFPPGLLTGSMYIGPGPGPAETAQADALTAYNDAANTVLNPCPGGNNLTGQDLGSVSSLIAPLLPGVYCFSTSAQLTGTLYLDFTSSSSFFIFQIGSTLTTASGSSVVAVGSPPACVANSIIWQVGSSATLGTGTTFLGDIIALASITADGTAGASNEGSFWALGGAVTLAGATTVTACGSSAPPPPTLPFIQALKFCDINGDGLLDTGDPSISNWEIILSPDPNKCSGFTNAAGLLTCESLPSPDIYDVYEGSESKCVHTATCIDGVCGSCLNSGGTGSAAPCGNDGDCTVVGETCVPTYPPANPVAIDLTSATSHHQVEFGNICLGTGGGETMAFWASAKGQALIDSADLTLLDGLNLVNANGTSFKPSSSAQLKTWLLAATNTNMAYMLSAELAAMELNVQHGYVNGAALVLAGTAPGVCSVSGLSATGFISINNLMADVTAQLAASGGNLTLVGNPKRVCQAFTENALNVTNNNANFAGCPTPVTRPTTCPTATPTPVG
ncbi:MAG: ice-binding family protein [Candidatus Binatus sp.]|uniref:ice-binding family protein n=1 Tax=Candidatus Binatus sp. TaxID=2811406 RepID=UPI003C7777C8